MTMQRHTVRSASRRWLTPLGLLAVLALLAGACATSGSDSDEESTEARSADEIATDGFDELGDVTLSVWADAGDEATLARAEEIFEAEYPNVDVQTTVRGFDDYIAIIVNTMQGDDAPDVAQGNQGYAVDGVLVGGDLILPLDGYAEVYAWTDDFSAGALEEFRFSEDGSTFGEGPLWGISPVSEFVGVYYNKQHLSDLGLEVPADYDAFVASLVAAADAGIRPIQMGNSEAWPGTHVFGLIQAAFTPAGEVRDWVTGTEGAAFNSDTTLQAATVMKEWADAGYFGDDYNGVSNDDAVARFIDGDGLYFMAGTWNTGTLTDNMGENVGFVPMPTGPSGVTGGTGSLGLGWHVSSKTENPDLAAAFVALLHSEEFADELAELGRVPVQPISIEASGLFGEVVAANDVINEADGFTFYGDWATDTMPDTLGAELQTMLGGNATPDEFVDNVQADWDAFIGG